MEENITNNAGTSDMPAPQIFNYGKNYKITDLFRNDLMTVLKEIPYVEAKKFLDGLDMYKEAIPIAALNEFIRALGTIPYKYFANFMRILEKKENFEKYFIELEEQKQ